MIPLMAGSVLTLAAPQPGQLRPVPAGPQRPDPPGPGPQPLHPHRDGLLFAHFYTKVYDHVLRPLMAPDRPNAPPELAAALDTLDQLAAGYITRARLPAAA